MKLRDALSYYAPALAILWLGALVILLTGVFVFPRSWPAALVVTVQFWTLAPLGFVTGLALILRALSRRAERA